LKKLALSGMKRLGMDQKIYFEWLQRAVNGLPVFWGGAEAFTENQKRDLLSARMRNKFSTLSSWDVLDPIWNRFQGKAWAQTHLNWMSYLDLNIRLPELLLMRVDKMSMGVGLEGRVPFLDHRFVELSMSIPEETKTRGGTLKYILKKAVRDVIPRDIIDREKQGFVVPVHDWFFDRLGTKTREALHAFCIETDFLDTRAVNRWIDRGRGSQTWYLLNLALWHEKYIAS
jgi:asparagine synthase (glutamine-hydrolysing)